MSEPQTEQHLRDALKAIPMIINASGRDGKEYVAIVFDPKLSGESITAPHRRKPPFRFNQFRKLLLATLAARAETESDSSKIRPGDIVILFDGGRHGQWMKINQAC